MKISFSILFILFSLPVFSQVAMQLPEVELFDIDGNVVQTSSLSNLDSPMIVFTYSFAKCGDCVSLLDDLNKSIAVESKKSGVKIVAINEDRDLSTSYIKAKVAEHGWSNFQALHDKNGKLFNALQDNRLPKILFLDANQNIIYCFENAKVSAKSIYDVVNLIKEKKATKDIIYFNSDWFPCDKSTAMYWRKIERNPDSTYEVTDYYMNGKPQMKGTYRRVYPEWADGYFSYYFETGITSSRGKRTADHKEGNWTTNYPDGKLKEYETFNYAKLHGFYSQNYPDGTTAINGEYWDGKPDETWKYFYENQAKKKEALWNRGKMVYCSGWYANGQLKFRIPSFDQEGNPLYLTCFYENGKRVNENIYASDSSITEVRQFYESGVLKSSSKLLAADNISYTEFYESGGKKMIYTLNAGNLLTGKFIKWYENGQKAVEMTFTKGNPSEIGMAWFENGTVKEKIDYTTNTDSYYNAEGIAIVGTKSIFQDYTGNANQKILINSTVGFYSNFVDQDLFNPRK